MPNKGEVVRMAEIDAAILDPINFGGGDLHAADETYEQAAQTVEQVKNYLVETTKHAPGQCIDGRCCVQTEAGGETVLGPKVAGGPALTALAATELVGGYFDETMTAEDKTGIVLSLLEKAGMKSGAHRTKAAAQNKFVNPTTGFEQTGCGAGEKFIHSLTALMKAEKDGDVLKTTALLTGKPFESEVVTESTIAQTYSAVSFYRHIAARYEGNHGEVLDGAHNESVVVFNTIKNTTIDRDAFVTETGKQVFVVDLWYIEDIADALTFGRVYASEKKQALVETMIAFQIETYNQLCDGSHRPVVLSRPTEVEA